MGISENSTQEDIKKKYKALVLKYHPDRNKNSNATKKFIEMQEAYKFLRATPTEREKLKTVINPYDNIWRAGNFSTTTASRTWNFSFG